MAKQKGKTAPAQIPFLKQIERQYKRTDLEACRSELEAMRREHKQLDLQLRHSESQLRSANDRLRTCDAGTREAERMRNRIRPLERDIAHLKMEKQETMEQMVSHKKTIASLQRDLRECNVSHTKTQQQLRSATSALNKKETETAARLRTYQLALTRADEKLRQQIQIQQEAIRSLKQQADTNLQTKTQNLQTRVRLLENELNLSKRTRDDLQKQLQKFNQEYKLIPNKRKESMKEGLLMFKRCFESTQNAECCLRDALRIANDGGGADVTRIRSLSKPIACLRKITVEDTQSKFLTLPPKVEKTTGGVMGVVCNERGKGVGLVTVAGVIPTQVFKVNKTMKVTLMNASNRNVLLATLKKAAFGGKLPADEAELLATNTKRQSGVLVGMKNGSVLLLNGRKDIQKRMMEEPSEFKTVVPPKPRKKKKKPIRQTVILAMVEEGVKKRRRRHKGKKSK